MKTLISIVGPTGIGKTSLAIQLAKYYKTEIISCDSRQFFREMPVGTAAPTDEELSQVRHHFIGNLSVTEPYSIGKFEIDALQKLEQLFQKVDIVVMVGGSMMYEKAVISGLDDLPVANEENQQKLKKIWEGQGLDAVCAILKDLDPEYYDLIDISNPRRLFRAIDIAWQTGQKYSELRSGNEIKRHFSVKRIGIEAPRDIIYNNINKRVLHMMDAGLLEEATRLFHKFPNADERPVALKTVGFNEIFSFLSGEYDLETAIAEIQKNTRRFAKRQLTWYRKETNIDWVQYDKAFPAAIEILNAYFDNQF